MPTFNITTPDGTKYVVNAPEGATEEQALARVQAQHTASQSAAPTKPLVAPNAAPMGAGATQPQITGLEASESGKTRSLGKAIKAGLANTGIQGYLGLKQIFTDLSPEEQTVRKISNNEANEDLTGKISNFVGDIALTALPAVKAGQVASRAAKILPRALQAGSTVLASGAGQGLASSAFEATDERDDRLAKFGKDAATGAAVSGVLGGATKLVTGAFKPTADAKALFDQGVSPTLAQGAENRIVKFLGGMTSNIADVSKRQGDETLDAVIRKVAPELDTAGKTVSEKIGLLKQVNDDLFDKALPNKVTLTIGDRQALFNTVNNAKLRSKTVPEALEAVGRIFAPTKNVLNVGKEKLSLYRADLQAEINRASKEFERSASGEAKETLDALIKVRNTFDKHILMKGATPEQEIALKAAKEQYDVLRRIADVGASAKGAREINVSKLRDMYAGDTGAQRMEAALESRPMVRDILGPANQVMGDTATYNQERAGMAALTRIGKALGAASASVLAPAVMGPAIGVSALGQTAAGSRALFGQYDKQKKLAELIRNSPGLANAVMNLDQEQ
jgi:hypothetical protein